MLIEVIAGKKRGDMRAKQNQTSFVCTELLRVFDPLMCDVFLPKPGESAGSLKLI